MSTFTAIYRNGTSRCGMSSGTPDQVYARLSAEAGIRRLEVHPVMDAGAWAELSEQPTHEA
jgi:hypothetical protein